MVLEIAERTLDKPLRKGADLISKHIAVLRKAGLVIQGRNRLYQLNANFVTDRETKSFDLGHCVLRLT